MKACLNALLILFTVIGHGSKAQSLPETTYSPKEQQDDLAFYISKLKRHHPNLYLYTAEPEFRKYTDSLSLSLTDTLTALEFYQKISTLSSLIKDGHTLVLPGEKITEYYNNTGLFLPCQLNLINDSLYVRQDYTIPGSIPEGALVLSINNKSYSEILEQLYLRQVRDGNNLNYARWILDTYFREYYSYAFGHPETYTIRYSFQGIEQSITIKGLSKNEIQQNRTSKYPGTQFIRQPGEGLQLQFGPNNAYALLTIKDFHDEFLKTVYKQNFKSAMADFFSRISAAQTRHLILDLRDNQGGDIENGVRLLANLMQEPFQVVRNYLCLKNGQLVHCSGSEKGEHQPVKKPYSGKLYVLINGGSFSNSVIVSSCLREHQRAIFIGEESGGNPHILAGNAADHELPHTKIRVEIPTLRFIMTNDSLNTGRGIEPDYRVINSIEDRIKAIDKPLEFAIRLSLR